MILNPKEDGITHINVYSKGKTELGRLLSNFAHTPFRVPFLGNFESVEGFWYYWLTGDEECKATHGFEAKELGLETLKFQKAKEERGVPYRWLMVAYRAKLKAHPKIRKMLKKNTLPLAHYYVYEGKVFVPKQWEWTATLWDSLV